MVVRNLHECGGFTPSFLLFVSIVIVYLKPWGFWRSVHITIWQSKGVYFLAIWHILVFLQLAWWGPNFDSPRCGFHSSGHIYVQNGSRKLQLVPSPDVCTLLQLAGYELIFSDKNFLPWLKLQCVFFFAHFVVGARDRSSNRENGLWLKFILGSFCLLLDRWYWSAWRQWLVQFSWRAMLKHFRFPYNICLPGAPELTGMQQPEFLL